MKAIARKYIRLTQRLSGRRYQPRTRHLIRWSLRKLELGLIGLEALLMYLVISAFIVQGYVIPSESMVPTLKPGDKVFVNKCVYWFRDPRPGEIAVFQPPDFVLAEDPQKPNYIKRAAGVSGDRLHVLSVPDGKPAHGVLTINGSRPDTGTPLDKIHYFWRANPHRKLRARVRLEQGYTVPGGEIFFMGDNTDNSFDSRNWGAIPLDRVRGKAFFRFWPPSRIGFLK
jgi:signal peptidase I